LSAREGCTTWLIPAVLKATKPVLLRVLRQHRRIYESRKRD
jgi:hypothetical protein